MSTRPPRCPRCGENLRDLKPALSRDIDTAADSLFALIVRTRFRNPGTSADPYTDAIISWLTVIHEAREILAPLDVPADTLSQVEYVYRQAVTAWLRGDEPTDDPGTAQHLADDEIVGRLREALDPPPVWIV